MRQVILASLLLLAACGEDDGTGTFPGTRGTLAEYFPVQAGSRFVYRRDGDPAQSATLTVQAQPGGLLLFELLASDPQVERIALLAQIVGEQIELRRLERGGVRVELDPALRVLRFPLEEGLAYSGATRVAVLGAQLGVDLLGVTASHGPVTVLERTYEQAFAVDIEVQTDLLGRTRVELVLAREVGPVSVQVISPALEMLGLSGLELRLELLSSTRRESW